MEKHPSIIVLDYLLFGGEVEFDGRTFVFDEDYHLCIKARSYTNYPSEEGSEDVLLKTHLDLKSFVEMCERISHEQLTVIGGNMALSEINKKIPAWKVRLAEKGKTIRKGRE